MRGGTPELQAAVEADVHQIADGVSESMPSATKTRKLWLRHVSEDTLERYSAGCLSEPKLGEVEEHLLACPECCGRLISIQACPSTSLG